MTMSLNQGSNGFWKVVEIDNAIFDDMHSFGKSKFFNILVLLVLEGHKFLRQITKLLIIGADPNCL